MNDYKKDLSSADSKKQGPNYDSSDSISNKFKREIFLCLSPLIDLTPAHDALNKVKRGTLLCSFSKKLILNGSIFVLKILCTKQVTGPGR